MYYLIIELVSPHILVHRDKQRCVNRLTDLASESRLKGKPVIRSLANGVSMSPSIYVRVQM